MRLFFSIAPEPSVLLDIENWRRQNWPLLERAVPVANLHLTLAFLGNCSVEQYEQIERFLSTFKMDEIEFSLDDLGYWPDSEVLWLGCSRRSEAIEELANFCTTTANRAGLRVSNRKFHPHLTLARHVKTPPTAPFFEPQFKSVATELQLQRSFRHRTGARYAVLSTW